MLFSLQSLFSALWTVTCGLVCLFLPNCASTLITFQPFHRDSLAPWKHYHLLHWQECLKKGVSSLHIAFRFQHLLFCITQHWLPENFSENPDPSAKLSASPQPLRRAGFSPWPSPTALQQGFELELPPLQAALNIRLSLQSLSFSSFKILWNSLCYMQIPG